MANDSKHQPEQTKAQANELTEEQLDEISGGRSDLGQQLQLALQEANNIYTRSTATTSSTQNKFAEINKAIAKNLR